MGGSTFISRKIHLNIMAPKISKCSDTVSRNTFLVSVIIQFCVSDLPIDYPPTPFMILIDAPLEWTGSSAAQVKCVLKYYESCIFQSTTSIILSSSPDRCGSCRMIEFNEIGINSTARQGKLSSYNSKFEMELVILLTAARRELFYVHSVFR